VIDAAGRIAAATGATIITAASAERGNGESHES